MRKLVLVVVLLASSGVSHADDGVGIGLFVGSPTGLDLKLGMGYRSNLDIVLGWNTVYHDGRDAYGHITYLATLGVARGRAVSVPIRLGVGVAVYDDGSFDSGVNVAVRAPLEIAFRFHSAPIELYGEVSLLVTFIDPNNNNNTFDVDGGIGFRVYF
jgi:hypothetical protein